MIKMAFKVCKSKLKMSTLDLFINRNKIAFFVFATLHQSCLITTWKCYLSRQALLFVGTAEFLCHFSVILTYSSPSWLIIASSSAKWSLKQPKLLNIADACDRHPQCSISFYTVSYTAILEPCMRFWCLFLLSSNEGSGESDSSKSFWIPYWRSSHYSVTRVRNKIVTFKGGHPMW